MVYGWPLLLARLFDPVTAIALTTNANGAASFSFSLPVSVDVKRVITATATDATGEPYSGPLRLARNKCQGVRRGSSDSEIGFAIISRPASANFSIENNGNSSTYLMFSRIERTGGELVTERLRTRVITVYFQSAFR